MEGVKLTVRKGNKDDHQHGSMSSTGIHSNDPNISEGEKKPPESSKNESLMVLPCCSRTGILLARSETTSNIHEKFGDSYCYLPSSNCQQQLTHQSPKQSRKYQAGFPGKE